MNQTVTSRNNDDPNPSFWNPIFAEIFRAGLQFKLSGSFSTRRQTQSRWTLMNITYNVHSGVNHGSFKLIKHGLLKKSNYKGSRILNIGSGPIRMATGFIEACAFEPISSEIILCEINNQFCNDYRKSHWYEKNANSNNKCKCSIKIINENIIDYPNKIPINSKFVTIFNLIILKHW